MADTDVKQWVENVTEGKSVNTLLQLDGFLRLPVIVGNDPRLGLVGEAILHILQLFLQKQHSKSLRIKEKVNSLRLWVDGYDIVAGGLDQCLHESEDLKEAVYVALYDLITSTEKCENLYYIVIPNMTDKCRRLSDIRCTGISGPQSH